MKLFDFTCDHCKKTIEVYDPEDKVLCEKCGKEMRKEMGGAKIIHSSAALWKVPLQQH